MDSRIAELIGDNASVSDFDDVNHESLCGPSAALASFRECKAKAGDTWGDNAMCKAYVAIMKNQRKKADRASARAAWVKDNPEAYAAEQSALAVQKAAMKGEG